MKAMAQEPLQLFSTEYLNYVLVETPVDDHCIAAGDLESAYQKPTALKVNGKRNLAPVSGPSHNHGPMTGVQRDAASAPGCRVDLPVYDTSRGRKRVS